MSKKSSKKKSRETDAIGPALNFSGREAYKLLRTNVMFSLPRDEKGARIVGLTSSVSGEGKSLTSINLAYSMAEMGLRVLLIECDMRKPTIGTKLGLHSAAGLSNLLARFSSSRDILHRSVMLQGMDVILAGDVPPNPSELLGSDAMQVVLNMMAKHYDYIILDLPPVGSVSDALVVSKFLDGVIVVVRQDTTSSMVLSSTMRQLKNVNAHIVGFVYNNASFQSKYYKKYTSNYYSS